MTAAIHICSICGDRDLSASQQEVPVRISDLVRQIAAELQPELQIEVQEFPCLGNCARRGRLSVGRPGSWSWLFADIDPLTDRDELKAFLRVWIASPDGWVVKEDRPPELRKRMLGRVPPLRR